MREWPARDTHHRDNTEETTMTDTTPLDGRPAPDFAPDHASKGSITNPVNVDSAGTPYLAARWLINRVEALGSDQYGTYLGYPMVAHVGDTDYPPIVNRWVRAKEDGERAALLPPVDAKDLAVRLNDVLVTTAARLGWTVTSPLDAYTSDDDGVVVLRTVVKRSS